MSKSIILYLIALIFFLLGGSMLGQYANASDPTTLDLLKGIGPVIIGIALLILSNSKAIKGESEQD